MWDGSIRVWGRASGELERTLHTTEGDPVKALAVCEDRLISIYHGDMSRVWIVATGESVFAGRSSGSEVRVLAVCGSRLASGCWHGSIEVWRMGAGAAWAWERSLLGHAGVVWSLAGWQDKVASGSGDGRIRVWDVGTGAHDATLAGHSGQVTALVVHGDRLLSASADGTIRAWGVGTWAVLRTVEVYGRATGPRLCCLAVSGSKLVSGSWANGGLQAEVRVWGLEELDLQQTLAQPAGLSVLALVAVDGEVWGGVDMDLVVWGRKA
jgi:WD40 repeat protein